MSKDRDRIVYRRSDGKWVNKRNDAGRASSLHDTQREAIGAARGILQKQGGGELTTKGREGSSEAKIQSRRAATPFPRGMQSTKAARLSVAAPRSELPRKIPFQKRAAHPENCAISPEFRVENQYGGQGDRQCRTGTASVPGAAVRVVVLGVH